MKTNNPNAFPTIEHGMSRVGTPEITTYEGMTLRDYFAAKAMQSIVSGGLTVTNEIYFESAFKEVSRTAYSIADAMLKQREP